MSFSGYYQRICNAGHYSVCDAFDEDVEPQCDCGAKIGWSNLVDQTNGYEGGDIPIKILEQHFLIKAPEIKKCDMGHEHVVLPAIYRVPTKKETDQLFFILRESIPK